jgi:putative hydrolase of the HAD superfamily
MEPFPDVHAALQKLQSRGLKLGLVSNAWPSLERKYREMDLRRFFDPFVVSAKVGCYKPDHRIFEVAIEASGLPPESLLFVDDMPEYVHAATKLGLHAVLMARNPDPPDTSLPLATSLADIEDLL